MKWINVSRYTTSRKRTHNVKFARFVRAEYMQKVKAEMFVKVVFD